MFTKLGIYLSKHLTRADVIIMDELKHLPPHGANTSCFGSIFALQSNKYKEN